MAVTNRSSSSSTNGHTTSTTLSGHLNSGKLNNQQHFYPYQNNAKTAQNSTKIELVNAGLARAAEGRQDQLQRSKLAAHRHLSAARAVAMRAPPPLPMVPMMIDDEEQSCERFMIDDDDIDEAGSTNYDDSDNLGHTASANNDISAYPRSLYSAQHDCVDSPNELVYQQQPQIRYLPLSSHSNQPTRQNADSGNSLLHRSHQQAMLLNATTKPSLHQQQQQHQLLYGSKHFPAAEQAVNSKYPQQLAIYHQPRLSHQYLHHYNQHTSYQQQQPAYTSADLNNNSNSNHNGYNNQHLPTSRSINGLNSNNLGYEQHFVERSSCESSDGRASQETKRKAKKMVPSSGSRQHLTPSADLHHQQSSSSKRKGASGRSKQTSGKLAAQRQHSDADALQRLSCCGKMAKLLLFISNISFWSAGIALGAWGILSLVEDHKYNLSQLLVFEPNSRMSLFQLLAWSFITLGCATVLVGFCGCSAILKNNRWILGLYIFLILAIFALDLATGLLAIIFQEKLVANVRLRLVSKLRAEYGVQASFTAALDYIQTKYECCGLEGHFDYDQSLWRLQRLGGFEATVARTCCHLRNSFDDQAHINPRPLNESMCQSTDVRFHQSYRYRKGCMDDLERLIRQKIWTFTIGCGAVGAVILLSLLFATCFCRSIPSSSSRKNSDPDSRERQVQSNHLDHKKQIASHHHHHHQQVEMQHNRHYR